MCANKKWLNSTLRNTWNFNGYVTSDCGAVKDVGAKEPQGHGFAADAAHAVSAFTYRVSSDSRSWEDHFASGGRLKATRAREAYLRAYPERPPEDVPLLSLDTAAWDAPFAEG